MTTLFYSPGACSLAPHIVLEWIGQPYAAHRVKYGSEELLAINPTGAVPALREDDGWILTQASAILDYLAQKHPEAGLGGNGDPRHAAELHKWTAFLTSDLHAAYWPFFMTDRFTTDTDKAARDAVVEAARLMIAKKLTILDEHMQGRDWMVGDMFGPRPSGFGAWRIQVDRPAHVTGMEFLQGVGGKAGAIPIGPDRMYLFNIRPERFDEFFPQDQMHSLLRERLAQFGGYVREIADSLTPQSPIVYGALEPFLLPVPWHRGRAVVGGDAAHVVPPHLTAGAAMAAEDAWALARAVLDGEGTVEDRLAAYGRARFARNAFVYSFARDWLAAEQAVDSPAALAAAAAEMRRNGSRRIAVADRFLEDNPL